MNHALTRSGGNAHFRARALASCDVGYGNALNASTSSDTASSSWTCSERTQISFNPSDTSGKQTRLVWLWVDVPETDCLFWQDSLVPEEQEDFSGGNSGDKLCDSSGAGESSIFSSCSLGSTEDEVSFESSGV